MRILAATPQQARASRFRLSSLAMTLTALAAGRFHASGTVEIVVNDWKGALRFKDGATAPEAEMSNGRAVVKARVNGAFTEALP